MSYNFSGKNSKDSSKAAMGFHGLSVRHFAFVSLNHKKPHRTLNTVFCAIHDQDVYTPSDQDCPQWSRRVH